APYAPGRHSDCSKACTLGVHLGVIRPKSWQLGPGSPASPRRRQHTMQLGVKLPHTGDAVADGSVPERARALEAAGFDSLWVSDHIALPDVIASPYPFAADGKATWPSDTPYLEPIVVLAAAAASTNRARIGTAVLVIPQRNPLLLAKQLASVAH